MVRAIRIPHAVGSGKLDEKCPPVVASPRAHVPPRCRSVPRCNCCARSGTLLQGTDPTNLNHPARLPYTRSMCSTTSAAPILRGPWRKAVKVTLTVSIPTRRSAPRSSYTHRPRRACDDASIRPRALPRASPPPTRPARHRGRRAGNFPHRSMRQATPKWAEERARRNTPEQVDRRFEW